MIKNLTAIPSVSLLMTAAALASATPDFQSQHLAVGFSRTAPAFSVFAVDSLGRGKLAGNPVLMPTNSVAVPGLELDGRFNYKLNGKPVWQITYTGKTLTLH